MRMPKWSRENVATNGSAQPAGKRVKRGVLTDQDQDIDELRAVNGGGDVYEQHLIQQREITPETQALIDAVE